MRKINIALLTVTILSTGILFAQVDSLVIATGVTVETTGGAYIELAGDLAENGTGYLKGKVSSGARTAETSFAGLTFNPGINGTIVRNTGVPYGEGNGEGSINLKRWYRLNLTAAAMTDVSATYVATGTHEEEGTLTGPYYLYEWDDGVGDWDVYGGGATASPITGNSVTLSMGEADILFSEGVEINSKLYIEGPYAGAGAMSVAINASIPLTSPYAQDPRIVSAIPATAVDWVLAEVRTGTGAGTIVGYRSCFLKSDGRLIGDDGSNDIGLPAMPDDYYIVLRHRNHLAIMTAAAETGLTWGGPHTNYDFSTGQAQAYGATPMIDVGSGVYGMYAGDANATGTINATDYLSVLPDIGSSGYFNSDVNLNSTVNATDYLVILPNIGKATQVP